MPASLVNTISGCVCEVFPEKTGISIGKQSKADALLSDECVSSNWLRA